MPTALITTPESLSLLLSYEESVEQFATLQCIIVDEWHELMGGKRGTQTELCVARLRTLAPQMRTWGLSATLGNLDQAMQVLVGSSERPAKMIRSSLTKQVQIETLLPAAMEKFPWSGHLGLRMLDGVVRAIENAASTLVFTNTRSQTEIWFAALQRERPKWKNKIALHHGSLDKELRVEVEDLLRLVFELAFEGIQHNPRNKSKLAVRFPRMVRWRQDKPAAEADSLDTMRALIAPLKAEA
jgi:ATP-dependent Lhr-like helicase